MYVESLSSLRSSSYKQHTLIYLLTTHREKEKEVYMYMYIYVCNTTNLLLRCSVTVLYTGVHGLQGDRIVIRHRPSLRQVACAKKVASSIRLAGQCYAYCPSFDFSPLFEVKLIPPSLIVILFFSELVCSAFFDLIWEIENLER